MNYEIKDCIDAGTEYCPCHLAETGDCILCSQLSGKSFCDCINWKGVCIYQEFIQNGSKAKEQRKNISCRVLKKEIIDNKLMIFTILVPHNLAKQLVHPGSFVFLREPNENQFYDAPISIMECNVDENYIKVAVEIKGVKTKTLNNIKEDERILVRGPFWNGVLGLRHLYKAKDGVSILICRGIGMAPMIPVLKKLYANGNKIIVILDKGNYSNLFIKDYLDMCNAVIIECNTLEKGELSDVCKEIIFDLLDRESENINLIHCDGPDILIYNVLNYIDEAKSICMNDSIAYERNLKALEKVKVSCCNNAKMCCGEGVCGTCSTRYKGHVVKKLCKVQVDPEYIFKGRRLI